MIWIPIAIIVFFLLFLVLWAFNEGAFRSERLEKLIQKVFHD